MCMKTLDKKKDYCIIKYGYLSYILILQEKKS